LGGHHHHVWEEGMDQLPKIVEFARKEGIRDENEKIDVSAHAVIAQRGRGYLERECSTAR